VITEKGRAQLADMDAAWQEMVQSIETLKNA
jgi:DNA-binding PadR family transcriptional regulator